MEYTEFERQYIETMLWASRGLTSSEETDVECLDAIAGIDDLSKEAIEKVKTDCKTFLEKYEEIETAHEFDLTNVAHDFWLTRNGHGAGFWDGDYPEPEGSKLTELAKSFGEQTPILGDDGLVYLS